MTKKIFTLVFALALTSFCFAQNQVSLPINFDSTNVSYLLGDFGGNGSAIVTDPVVSTNKVCKITKSNTAETWAGTTLGTNGLVSAVPFTSTLTRLTMRVYSPDSGIVVRMKVEDQNDQTKSCETDAKTSVKNGWETLTFNFANQASGTAALNLTYSYKKLSVFFNFGTNGATAGTKIYYCDDIVFLTSGPTLKKIDLPINFDSTNVDYTMTDFGGNGSSVVADPMNPANKVGKAVKANTAELWAGTTISTPSGLATAIPFSAGNTKMSVAVYSPDSGIVVKLKVEDPNDPTKSCETDVKTTVKNAWQVLVFDFANQSSGTAALNFSYTYKMVSIFFNFGVNGATAGTKTYYFDNVVFGTGNPPPPPYKVNIKFKVDMKNKTMNANDTVTLNGTFNGWCGICTPMTNIPGTKIYTVTVALDSGADYEYKYTIGNWTQQETLATTLPCTKTTSGYTNRTLRTGTKDDSTIAVCWQACTLCTGSGIDKKDETRIQVYPNPASQTVHLNLGGFASQVKSIRIYNTLGEQISAGTSLNADNNNVIDVDIRSLKPGIYMAKFEMGENTQVVKFQVN